jgi:hypothetical protein
MTLYEGIAHSNGQIAEHPASTPVRLRKTRARKTLDQRFGHLIDRSGGPDACHPINKALDPASGYPKVSFAGKTVTYARAMWLEMFGEDSLTSNDLICHSCGDKLCCNPAHHYKGTRKSNAQDCGRHGTQGKRKLKKAQVRAIFIAYHKRGAKQQMLSAKYGVTPEQIRHIAKRRRWAKATADLVHLIKKPKKGRAVRTSNLIEVRV